MKLLSNPRTTRDFPSWWDAAVEYDSCVLYPRRARAWSVTSGSSSARASCHHAGERAVTGAFHNGLLKLCVYFMINTSRTSNIINLRPQWYTSSSYTLWGISCTYFWFCEFHTTDSSDLAAGNAYLHMVVRIQR